MSKYNDIKKVMQQIDDYISKYPEMQITLRIWTKINGELVYEMEKPRHILFGDEGEAL